MKREILLFILIGKRFDALRIAGDIALKNHALLLRVDLRAELLNKRKQLIIGGVEYEIHLPAGVVFRQIISDFGVSRDRAREPDEHLHIADLRFLREHEKAGHFAVFEYAEHAVLRPAGRLYKVALHILRRADHRLRISGVRVDFVNEIPIGIE